MAHPRPARGSCPLTVQAAVDRDFIPIRFQALEIAAFLDRLTRCQDAGQAPEDFRVAALRQALTLLADAQDDKARRMQEAFSDLSTEPLAKAPGKGACGAVPPTR